MSLSDANDFLGGKLEPIPCSPRPHPIARILLVYIMLFLAVYLVTIVTPYGFLDDYSALRNAMLRQMSAQSLKATGGGRPVYALLMCLVLPMMRSVGDLRFLRAISVVSIGLVALACHVWLS